MNKCTLCGGSITGDNGFARSLLDKKLKGFVHFLGKCEPFLYAKIKEIEAERDEFKVALEWYADEQNWKRLGGMKSFCEIEQNARAKFALKKRK
jgi:hypothetical protein